MKLSRMIFILVIVMIAFGMLPMLSASFAFSEKIYGNSFYMIINQAQYALIGIFGMILLSAFQYESIRKFSLFVLIVTLAGVVALYFYASEVKGAKRSLPLFGYSVQVIEFARLAFIVHLSSMLARQGDLVNDFKKGLIFPLFWMVLFAGVIYGLPNVSNSVMFVLIGIGLLFISKLKFTRLALTGFTLISTVGLAAFAAPHGRDRLMAFFNRVFGNGENGFQIQQSIIGIGSGGIFGLGAGKSNMSNLFLPEAWGDFIFSIIGEEWGFLVTALIVLLYLVLFLAGMKVARDAKDLFGKYLAFGISLSFILYAFVNILVATGKVPTTGLPLPFISQGGASMLSMCFAFGILISIASSNENAEQIVVEGKTETEEDEK
ncbi:MAG: cell division protein FtsW [Ignavibacteriales bacterium]